MGIDASCVGTTPCRELLWRFMLRMEVNSPSSAGMESVKAFNEISRDIMLVHNPNSEGMEPLNDDLEISNRVKPVSRPISVPSSP